MATIQEEVVCQICNTSKHWRRFRVRIGGGSFMESPYCSECRNRLASAATRKKKKLEKQVVLNRTLHEEALQKDYPHHFPKHERAIRAYCNRKTAMDRKYLRDHQHLPAHPNPRIHKQRQLAIKHAKGWIALYDDICNHAINLLRQSGARPSFAAMEKSADLQKLYGVWNTKRASRLRGW